MAWGALALRARRGAHQKSFTRRRWPLAFEQRKPKKVRPSAARSCAASPHCGSVLAYSGIGDDGRSEPFGA
jgi:hypothetical protein